MVFWREKFVWAQKNKNKNESASQSTGAGHRKQRQQGPGAPSGILNAGFLFAEQEAKQRRQPAGSRPCPRGGGGGSALLKGGPCTESWGAARTHRPQPQGEEAMEPQ